MERGQNLRIEKTLPNIPPPLCKNEFGMTRRFDSYEDLEKYLRDWVAWGYPLLSQEYDLVRMACLLGACLDNLRENAPELEDIREALSDEQRAFLAELSQVKKP